MQTQENESPIDQECLRKCADALANWWGAFLEAPVIPDNGDESMHGMMATSMGALLQSKLSRKSEAQIAAFVVELSKLLVEEFMARGGRWGLPVGVDYHPDPIFHQAALAAGFSLHDMVELPWKTRSELHSDHVIVRAGYGAPSRVIFDLRTTAQGE